MLNEPRWQGMMTTCQGQLEQKVPDPFFPLFSIDACENPWETLGYVALGTPCAEGKNCLLISRIVIRLSERSTVVVIRRASEKSQMKGARAMHFPPAILAPLFVAICLAGCGPPAQVSVDPTLPKHEQATLYVEWLRHIDPHVVHQGKQRLRELGEGAVPAITIALSDKHGGVRRAAAQVLEEIRDDQTRPVPAED